MRRMSSVAARSRWRGLGLAAWLAAASLPAAAQQPVPPLTGHVVDTTGTLSADALAESRAEARGVRGPQG